MKNNRIQEKKMPATGNDGLCKNYNLHTTSAAMLQQDQIDFAKLKQDLQPHIPSILKLLLSGGKLQGSEFMALNPTRNDKQLGSFKINVYTGKWADFSTGDKGSDIIALWAYVRKISKKNAANELLSLIGGY